MESSRSFLISYLKKLPLGLISLLLLFAGALYLFGLLVNEVLWEKEEELDEYVFRFISARLISGRLTSFMEGVTYFASATFMQLAYAVLVVFYLILKNFKRAVEIAIVGVGGYIINYLMKFAFQRERPEDPLIEPLHNFSFPSGHATSAFIFYGLLAYLLWKTSTPKWLKFASATVLILFSILIGFSRVYLRLHYTSDVLAGFCIGFAWLSLTIFLFEKLKKKADKEDDEVKSMQH